MGHYYHLYANGDDARNFITTKEDFEAAFNRFGICAAKNPEVQVLAFSIEESHPHCLLFGTYENCFDFKHDYESSTFHYIRLSRGDTDNVIFELEITAIVNESYLLNAAAYIIVQPTKDGKQIMPYDYKWGTGSMYFRPEGYPQLWLYDENWVQKEPIRFGSMTYRQKCWLMHSKFMIPNDWLICNGLILPSNYLAVQQYEFIFKSFNRFRTFLCAGRKQHQEIIDTMAATRGITLNDLEARKLSYDISQELFGKKDSRWLSPEQRLVLARELRNKYRLSFRQIATLSRLPETEIRKYVQ